MTVWLTMLAAGFLTYLTRLSFIGLFGNRPIPVYFKRALRFVPPAVMTAIIIPELLIQDDALFIAPTNFRLIAGVTAIIVAWVTKSMAATIVVGMVVLLALQIILG